MNRSRARLSREVIISLFSKLVGPRAPSSTRKVLINSSKFARCPPRRSELEHFPFEETLKDPGLFSLSRNGFKGDLTTDLNGYKLVLEEMEPGFSQWHMVEGREVACIY